MRLPFSFWKSASAPAPSYSFIETFEGSNADSQSQVGCDNAGWTSSSAANTPHYTTSPAPLAGSYSLRIQLAGRTYINSLPASGGTTVGFYAMMHWTGTQGATAGISVSLRDSGGTNVCGIESRGSGNWRLVHGTTTGAPFAINIDTVHHIWIDYSKDTGANGVVSIYLSANATKPASPTSAITNGNGTADVAQVRLAGLSNDTLWDNVVCDATQYIGSNPVP